MNKRVVILALLVTVPVLADAPANQYASFVDTDLTITDNFTHLTWERPTSASPYPEARPYADAETHCRNRGQRLPTLKELLTLVDEDPHEEYEGTQSVMKMIDGSAFKRTPISAGFWTSSLPPSGEHATVSFADGTTGSALATDNRYVRCVTAIP